MAAKRLDWTGVLWCLVSAMAVALLGGAGPVLAAPVPGDQQYAKYYVVGDSYQGQPENLSEIASRFLGTADRVPEVFNLNAGRRQPDGGILTDSRVLPPGWQIVLPWDAAGEGVQYGLLLDPSGAPANPQPGKPAVPPATIGAPPPTAGGGCATTHAGGEMSNWAQRAVVADVAWQTTKGKGIMVAVVDSGVDAGVPQLAGRVAVGADITAGSNRGNVDCLGSGTAMAGIIAAAGSAEGGPIGLAPEATVLPIRVVTTAPGVKPADAATAVEVAVAAGAKVIALGSHVDLAAPPVAAAVDVALGHGVLVVAGAPVADQPGTAANRSASPSTVDASGALLHVGAAGERRWPAEHYRPGTVDLLAPGVGVTSVGIGGSGVRAVSGTPYAVAAVAGVAALVQSAHPNLTAAQVAYRIKVTSMSLGSAVPDATTGWGMVNAQSAVTNVLSEEGHDVRPAAVTGKSGSAGGLAVAALVALVMVVLAAGAVLAGQARRARLARADAEVASEAGPAATEEKEPPRGDGRRDEPYSGKDN
ncbi:S8 family serine peptidase [Micromonospora sp. CB01531]|uniref:S8 family serine peptidase n=1 Tax=Micromonospora sp. CB01531 TaxID=1718947 RepID=UPI00093EFA27|nr:S8 family serine peptidase [Micromonospora sp. CB01531]OKI78003.1 hypothetical protein A6A27_40655 [Micromonospora sp. CB01531]